MPDTQIRTKSRMRRVFGIMFWIIVFCILGFAAWLSGDVIAAASDRITIQMDYNAKKDDFVQQATQIAEPSASSKHENAGIALMMHRQPVQQDTPVPQVPDFILATNTPRPEIAVTIPALNTLVPAVTPTLMAVEPLVLPTIIFPDDAPQYLIDAAPTAVPTRIDPITRDYDLVNIVLLGSDEEITNDNTQRTDTMIIVSINRDTGTISMLSLPRDLYVFIPGLGMNRLNVAYGWGENAGWTNGGFGLFRDTIIYNFGINVHYFARVNITGLEQIVDLLGGVDIGVDCAIQDYYPVAPIEELDLTRPIEENYKLRTLDVGYYTMDGFDAQWYARSRKNSSDFDRGRRQQQLIRAIFRKALREGRLTDLPQLWDEGMEIVDTNLTLTDMLSLLPIALEIESREIESFTFIPTYHTQAWTPPDGANVQLPVYETMIPLLQDFYTPPTENQVSVRGATVRVLNATDKQNLDLVAVERLQYGGFAAFGGGQSNAGTYTDTMLVDYTGQTKGSSRFDIADVLNIPLANIIDQPDPNRVADFDVILQENYSSCTFGVLPVESE